MQMGFFSSSYVCVCVRFFFLAQNSFGNMGRTPWQKSHRQYTQNNHNHIEEEEEEEVKILLDLAPLFLLHTVDQTQRERKTNKTHWSLSHFKMRNNNNRKKTSRKNEARYTIITTCLTSSRPLDRTHTRSTFFPVSRFCLLCWEDYEFDYSSTYFWWGYARLRYFFLS